MHKGKEQQSRGQLADPMAVARGLGSAHRGLDRWLSLRFSAVLLLPLSFWLVWTVVRVGGDYAAFFAWLHRPLNAVLMVVTVLPLFYHTVYGLQEVVEDYIHGHAVKLCTLAAIKLAGLVAVIVCLFSILKIAFSG